ncbi:flagellar export chaperone FliS [Fundidesulfovibrio agrisoli]|uniref:flagellar export chaperone FliS n=1 Tax=Fundidesulfovibrio agrisoli TaxID=2922717 RepID=UPI001FADA77E|nr:flagellar export chaperone FliS [Fundidesulfovibrio agrisoli]
MQKAAQAYIQTQVNTVTQGDLVIMLFDGCIKFLRQAKEAMSDKDYARKGVLISKALDVIAELQSSLNLQKGGEVAENLSKLYLLCSTKLLMANMNMDQGIVDQVVNMLSGVRDAFAQINTPEFVPQAPVATQQARSTGPGLATAGMAAPSAGAPVHKAFAAYSQAKK